MPEPQQIKKAYLQKITWSKNGQVESEGEKFFVQFNPQSLKVNYSNQKSGNDQRGGSAIQFVGQGATKLSVELLFDVTVPLGDGTKKDDVANLTGRVAEFIKPDPSKNVSKKKDEVKIIPPGIRFGWGKFSFEGVVDSINETLDFFSNEGKPLRATVALEISRQDIIVRPTDKSPGTTELQEIKDGETVQQAASKNGQRDNWPATAEANGIENPRQVPPGSMLDMGAGVSAGVSAGAGISGGISAGVGAGVSGGFSAGAGISGGISAGAGASAGFGAGVSASGGLSASAGVSAGAAGKLSIGAASQLGFGASSRSGVSSGFSGGAGFGGGATAGFGGSASAGLGGSASGGIGGGASAGIGGGASAGIGGGVSAGGGGSLTGGASGSAGFGF